MVIEQQPQPENTMLEEFRAANLAIVRHLTTPDTERPSWPTLDTLVETTDAIGRRLIGSHDRQPLDKDHSIGGLIMRVLARSEQKTAS